MSEPAGDVLKRRWGAVTASLFATTRMAHFGPKSVPGAAPRRLRRWSPCGHTSSDRDTSGRLRYAETVNCTLPMSPGTSGEPHAVAVNERIHTEGAPRGHSHCSSQLFTPSPPFATAVKSEIGSVENTLLACRNPLETSRDDVGGRHGELYRNHPYGPFWPKISPR